MSTRQPTPIDTVNELIYDLRLGCSKKKHKATDEKTEQTTEEKLKEAIARVRVLELKIGQVEEEKKKEESKFHSYKEDFDGTCSTLEIFIKKNAKLRRMFYNAKVCIKKLKNHISALKKENARLCDDLTRV
jgi:hypothetical protein